MFRTIATIERSRSLTIFRIALTTTSTPTGGRTTAGIPAGITPINIGVTPTNTRVTTTNTRVTPKSTGGGAQRRTPRPRRGWHAIALEATVTAALKVPTTVALEATITA